MATRDVAIRVDAHPREHVAAEALDQRETLAQFTGLDKLSPNRPVGSRSMICSMRLRLCSTSRMRIHTRALTSPSSRTGTSKSRSS